VSEFPGGKEIVVDPSVGLYEKYTWVWWYCYFSRWIV